jgi:hypothetical protein
MVMTARTTG